MKKSTFAAFLVSSVFLLCTACSTLPVIDPSLDKDPAVAASLAFNHGDYRLMIINGVHPVYPGVPGDYLELSRRFEPTRSSYGPTTTDEAYAAAFNRQMLTLRGCNPDKPLERCK